MERPAHALSLFDGSGLDGWASLGGTEAGWRVEGGELVVVPGAGDIVSRQAFRDLQLHLEFCLPESGNAVGQDRANSGVYLQGRFELQILDSYGRETAIDGCGAIYKSNAPLWNVCRAPGVWQALDVAFRAGSAATTPAGLPRLTALLNGVVIHNNVLIPAVTAGALDEDMIGPGPIRLQDHGSPVRFRNIWALVPPQPRP